MYKELAQCYARNTYPRARASTRSLSQWIWTWITLIVWFTYQIISFSFCTVCLMFVCMRIVSLWQRTVLARVLWLCAKTTEPSHDGKNVSFHKINNIYIGFLNKFLSIRKYCSTPHLTYFKKIIFFSVVIFYFFFFAVRSYVRSFGKYLPFHLYECVFAIHISLWFHEKFQPKIYSYRAYELMAKDERTRLLCDERRRASTCPEDFSFKFLVCGKTIDI